MALPKGVARNIPLFYINIFFDALIFIIPIWVAYERQFMSFSQMSLLASAIYMLKVILELPTGAFADLFGRRNSMFLGYSIYVVAYAMMAFADNAPIFIAGATIRQIGETFISGSNNSLMYDSLKQLGREKEFSKIWSRLTLIMQNGIIISSIGAGYFFEIWKGLPYFMTGVSMLFGGIAVALMVEPHIDSEKFTFSNYILQTKLGLQQTLRTVHIKQLSIFYALVGGITWAWQIYFNQIYASSIGYSEVGKSWLFAIIRLVNVFIIIKLFHADRRLNETNAYNFFAIIISLALLAAIPNTPLGTILLFVFTLSSTLRFIVLDGIVNEHFDSKYRATANSALNMYVSFVYSGIVLVGGLLLDYLSAGWIYLGIGILGIAILVPLGITLTKYHS